ncbi:MAG TPA: hypothetical protein VKS21_01150 [Spirochaetota bacterium]|nr:hypothetical protein [Spirochaetota bacterium]
MAKNFSVRSMEITAFSGTLAFAFLANAALRFRLKVILTFFGSKGPFKSGNLPAPSSTVSLPEDPCKEEFPKRMPVSARLWLQTYCVTRHLRRKLTSGSMQRQVYRGYKKYFLY